MDYKEKYKKLVEQIRMESEWAYERRRRDREKDKPKLDLLNTGMCFAYESIMSAIDMLEEEQ